MSETKIQKEIREMEEAGLDVVATHNGKLTHVTGGINNSPELCDSCNCLIFAPDPDPDDWFRDNDQKAVCTKMKATIVGSLERPSEMVNIRKPLWCPKLGIELTAKEKRIASKRLKLDQKRYNS